MKYVLFLFPFLFNWLLKGKYYFELVILALCVFFIIQILKESELNISEKIKESLIVSLMIAAACLLFVGLLDFFFGTAIGTMLKIASFNLIQFDANENLDYSFFLIMLSIVLLFIIEVIGYSILKSKKESLNLENMSFIKKFFTIRKQIEYEINDIYDKTLKKYYFFMCLYFAIAYVTFIYF